MFTNIFLFIFATFFCVFNVFYFYLNVFTSLLATVNYANLHKWGLAQSPSCDCGQRQTMNHIVDTCPLTKFEGGLNLLHEVDDDAVIWLESTATAALAK